MASPAGRIDGRASLAHLDLLIKESLSTFYGDICSPAWFGREREMVSLFAFAHLATRCTNGSLSLAQIGIEVAVPQLPPDTANPTRRGTVCKDLVIWREPKSTMWVSPLGPYREPIAVMEWKVVHEFNRRSRTLIQAERTADISWLKEKSIRTDGFAGYSVFIETWRRPRTLECSRILHGEVHDDWLALAEDSNSHSRN